MSGLKKLLIDLGQHAELQREYERDPKAVMGRYELGDEAMEAMLNKDVPTLKRLSGLDELKSNGHVQAPDYD
ncbi:MAG: hypothetical protein R3200_16585 [Xanthomonadales bacterium]|nr:hypothetical protein [Xanthomonadales bacterium]